MERRRKKAESMAYSSSAPPSPAWVDLPWEITANILERLDAEEKLVTAQVCTTWRSVCKDPSFWRKIHISRDPSRRVDYEIMCRHAVDRSQGQLRDLSISGFGSNSLLNHIAERSYGLQFLSMVICDEITKVDDSVDATEGLHLLAERFSCSSESGFMGLIYHSFPALKSLTINWTMVGSRLTMIGRRATKVGIEKIMDEVRYLRIMGMSLCKLFPGPLFKACVDLKSLNMELGFNLCISRKMADKVFQYINYQQPSFAFYGYCRDSGFRGDYKMHYRGSTCVRISLVYTPLV